MILTLFHRDFVIQFKQTIFGPIWYLLHPIISTAVFYFFMTKINPNGAASFLNLFVGVIFWNLFLENTTRVMNIFRENHHIISKVYIPKMIFPLSATLSSFSKFLLQFCVLLVCLLFTSQTNVFQFENFSVLIISIFLLLISSIAFGIFFAAMTYKYKDVAMMISYGLQLLFFLTPVLYSTPSAKGVSASFNPLTIIFINLKNAILIPDANFNFSFYLYYSVFIIALLYMAIVVFQKVENNLTEQH